MTTNIEFVSVTDPITGRESSLATKGHRQSPHSFRVLGILGHGTEFAPASVADAQAMIATLQDWIKEYGK